MLDPGAHEDDLADLTGLRVLVVEDDADARELLVATFVESGAEVFEAASADEAFALLRRVRPDVLVSDIGLPDHDGYELVRWVRALGSEEGGLVPAIALTGYPDGDAALVAGFQLHVAKPVDVAQLTKAVVRVAAMRLALAVK